ncbi:polyhydroxyalkanoate granule-associated phasin [Roseateles violae]|uniref:Phasin domain-containing protein n=1 Tax=Roseateles violae TaxID=3058042 RepID=A0ABT8E0A8_9BURK|nr:polyhydroxyalkanoate granule-associated phasin [Pelomonas sp. PFR6]MDN3923280.1 hypothetical protein [Pelomonas sp. PFR6]
MPKRQTQSLSLARKTAELSIAAPLVVSHRLARMAAAGANPSARNSAEFRRMFDEKTVAFSQAWNAMALQTLRANQAFASAAFRSLMFPWMKSPRSASALAASFQSATWGILAKGLAPVHGKAMANAKRLGRSRKQP